MSDYDHAPTRDDTDVIGKRAGAQLIDLFTIAILAYGSLFILGALGAAAGGQGSALQSLLGTLGALVFTGILIGYSFILEAVWNGQTIGKRLLGIRAVKEDGSELPVGSAFIRNIPGMFSLAWIVYLVALFSMASSDKRQRLFDRLAGTVVVKEGGGNGEPDQRPNNPNQGQQPQNNPRQGQNQRPPQQQPNNPGNQ